MSKPSRKKAQPVQPVPTVPASKRHKVTLGWEEAIKPFLKSEKFETVYEPLQPGEEYDALLGKGHYGTVLEYNHKQDDTYHAVKRIKDDGLARQNLANELTVHSRLGEHPAIPEIFGLYIDANAKMFFLAMELCGESLHEELAVMKSCSKVMRPEILKEIARELLDALAFMHHRGVAHRDLKLENILSKNCDSIVPICVIDFDYSFVAEEGHEPKSDTLAGTFVYMAPEIVRRWMDQIIDLSQSDLKGTTYAAPKQYNFTWDTRADVFAFGVIIYELATNHEPYPVTGCPRHQKQTTQECFHCMDDRLTRMKQMSLQNYFKDRWKALVPNLQQLMIRAMEYDQENRLTASELLQMYPLIDKPVQKQIATKAAQLAVDTTSHKKPSPSAVVKTKAPSPDPIQIEPITQDMKRMAVQPTDSPSASCSTPVSGTRKSRSSSSSYWDSPEPGEVDEFLSDKSLQEVDDPFLQSDSREDLERKATTNAALSERLSRGK